MVGVAPSRETELLSAFRRAMASGNLPAAEPLLPGLEGEGLLEDAFAIFREARRNMADSEGLQAFGKRLSERAMGVRLHRAASWRLDARRTSVRFSYAKRSLLLDFDSGDLHRLFLAAFRLEGLSLALDLSQHPRPMLQLGPPLPAGVGGEEEWGELVLRRMPPDPQGLQTRLEARLPLGLQLRTWEEQPDYASPVADLAETSFWRWSCPPARAAEARARTEAFLASEHVLWDRAGKLAGQKQEKSVDLRPLVASLAWEGAILQFTTPMRAFGATNPLKALGAILGWNPEEIQGLVRTSLHLARDPRLAQGERFEPKLRNLYEDAVLLSGGSNITLIDDEDDEPLRLG
ncbi:MAG TPA: TIGR03936 family radical SAM-associated protein [Holophagaceae bacterium]